MSGVVMTTLGESCEFFNGKAHEKDIDLDGKYIVVNSKFISQDGKVLKRTKEQMFPLFKGDIVMVMSDVPNGKALAKCAIIDEDETYSLNQRICCIRSKEFDTKYLYYQLNRNEHFLAFNNGENQTNLRKADILACPLLKPSLEEQKRIVAELESTLFSLDQAKVNTEKNLRYAKEIFESYLQGVFKNQGENWEEKTFGQVFEIKPQKKEAREKLSENDLVSFLPMEDLGICENEIKPLKEKPLKDVVGSYTYFAENDLLLAKITPCFENGKLGIAKKLKNGIGFGSSEYIVFRCPENIDPEFAFYFLSRDSFREEGKQFMGGAVGHKRVSKEWIENYLFAYPRSKEEQTTIVRQFDLVRSETQKLETLYQKKIAALDELKKSVLQKAFQVEIKAEKDLTV